MRYSKIQSASATLARRKYLSEPQQQNIARLVTSGRVTRVNISPLIANGKQWSMSSPNICLFLGIGRGKHLSGCGFVWFSALVYCRRKSYLVSTLRIVCHRVKVLSSRLCSIVASLSASSWTTREYCIDKVEHWTINTLKRKREHVSLIILSPHEKKI